MDKPSKDKTVPICKGGTQTKGVSNTALKKYGRGMAKVMNQKGSRK